MRNGTKGALDITAYVQNHTNHLFKDVDVSNSITLGISRALLNDIKFYLLPPTAPTAW